MPCDVLGSSGPVAIAFSLRKKIVDVQSGTLASFFNVTVASSIAMKPLSSLKFDKSLANIVS
jgi:hypothetical protein